MRILPFLILVAFFSVPGLATQTVHAAGFDCAKAASRVEKLICADSELSALDDRLAATYKAALAAAPAPEAREALKAEQRTWLKSRDACRDKACLEEAYAAREQALAANAQDAGAPGEQERLKESLKRREELFQRLQWSKNCEDEFREDLRGEILGGDSDLLLGEEGGAAGVETHTLPNKELLTLIECGQAAYQISFAASLHEGNVTGPGQNVVFTEYERAPSGEVSTERTDMIAGIPDFDQAKGMLTVLTKSRGPGDCGSLVVYAFDGGAARVVSARAQACFDDGREWVEPEKWPLATTP